VELQLRQLRWPADRVDPRETADAMFGSSQRGRLILVAAQREPRSSDTDIFISRFAAKARRQRLGH